MLHTVGDAQPTRRPARPVSQYIHHVIYRGAESTEPLPLTAACFYFTAHYFFLFELQCHRELPSIIDIIIQPP